MRWVRSPADEGGVTVSGLHFYEYLKELQKLHFFS